MTFKIPLIYWGCEGLSSHHPHWHRQ